MFAKKIILTLIIFNMISLSSSFNCSIVNAGFAETNEYLPESFKLHLKRGKLTFKAPSMKLSAVKKDPLMNYDAAYLDKTKDFEIRINIVPLDSNDAPEENLDILTLAKEGIYEAIEKRMYFNHS